MVLGNKVVVKPRDQVGQVLLELVVAVALLTALSVWGASQWEIKLQQAKTDAMAAWLTEVYRAVNVSDTLEHIALRVAQDGNNSLGDRTGLIDELKRRAKLPTGFTAQAPMNYHTALIPVSDERCQTRGCVDEVLLIAVPAAQLGAAHAQRNALDLLLALKGQVGMVPWNRPGYVKGPNMEYRSLRWQGALLPVGTLVFMVWGSSQILPYVRLREDRPTALNGYMNFGSTVRFLDIPRADEGIAIGKIVTEGSSCQVHNHLALMGGGGMALCQSGRWMALRQPQRYKACDSVVQGDVDVYQQGLISINGLGLSPGNRVTQCICPVGLIARYLGSGTHSFQGVSVHGGFLCELP